MFTGIIEEIGTLRLVRRGTHSSTVTIGAKKVLNGLQLGDSIAVNGVCLTATASSGTDFTADIMHETLNRSTLGGLRPGSRVNLERAMRADGRFGGHIVSGHIDGTGVITGVRKDDIAVWYTIRTAPSVLRYIVEKGSIAVDGISLTVASVEKDGFRVSVIPHTAAETTLSHRQTGDKVNLENDIVGKYIEKLLGVAAGQPAITKRYLEKYGF